MRNFVVGALLLAIVHAVAAAPHEFEFKKADAQSVALVAEFDQWKAQPMTKRSDGTWALTVSIPPGTYGYKFLVNGSEWVFDPANPMRKKVDGIENSAVEVGEGTGKATPGPTLGKTVIASTSTIGSDPVFKSGEVVIVDAPLSAAERIEASKGGNPAVSMAKVAVGVPAGFDAQKPWPILIISATVTAPNIDLLNLYKQGALDEGWVVMAADGPEKPKDDSNSWRLAMIGAGLDYMAAKWPASKTWPVACGGMSGGAKRTGFVAAALAKEGRNVIGMLMGGCNQDMATLGLHDYRPPSSAFKNVPIFLSSGANDTIATPSQTEYVRGSMKASGFRKLRLESFPGAHDVYAQHTTDALRWFIAESSATKPAAATSSSFDQFFKKKP